MRFIRISALLVWVMMIVIVGYLSSTAQSHVQNKMKRGKDVAKIVVNNKKNGKFNYNSLEADIYL